MCGWRLDRKTVREGIGMQIGCCVELQYYDAVAAAGFDTITLPAKEVAAWSEQTFCKVLEQVKSGPLKLMGLNAFCPSTLKLNGEGYSTRAVRAYSEPLLQRASRLGIHYVGIGAPASRNIAKGSDPAQALEQFHESVHTICALAHAYGIEILLESVCTAECNFITRTYEADALLHMWQIPNLKLVYDVYHEMWEQEPPSRIAEFAEQIRVVHLARAHEGKRFYPNDTGLDFCAPYIDALRACGYQGEICMEAFEGNVTEGILQSGRCMQVLRG